MTISVIVAIISLCLAVLVHAVASIWWASRITTTVEGISKFLDKIEKEFEKRDSGMKAMWERIDEIKGRVTHLEARRMNG